MPENNDITTVQVKISTCNELKEIKEHGETHDDVIQKAIEAYKAVTDVYENEIQS